MRGPGQPLTGGAGRDASECALAGGKGGAVGTAPLGGAFRLPASFEGGDSLILKDEKNSQPTRHHPPQKKLSLKGACSG